MTKAEALARIEELEERVSELEDETWEPGSLRDILDHLENWHMDSADRLEVLESISGGSHLLDLIDSMTLGEQSDLLRSLLNDPRFDMVRRTLDRDEWSRRLSA